MNRKRDYLPQLVERLKIDAPVLSDRRLHDLVIESVPRSQSYGRILRYLELHPDALHAGRADMQPCLIRIVDRLVAAGARNIRRPMCVICNEPKALPYKNQDGRVCGACFARYINVGECATCGRHRGIALRMPNGASVCGLCRRMETPEPCSVCNTVTMVAARPKGQPVCQLCYQRPRRRCDICGEVRAVHSKKTGVTLCRQCYSNPNFEPRRRKGRHRNMRRRQCCGCRATRLCVDYLTDSPMCVVCAGRPLKRCTRCGEERPVQANLNAGPVCSKCYDSMRILVPRNFNKKPRDAGPTLGICSVCGIKIHLYKEGVCITCITRRQVELVLCDASGEIPPPLRPVVGVLLNNRSPIAVLGWLERSESASLLRAIASGKQPLSHAALDGESYSPSAEYLRSILMKAGAIPRITDRDRLERWLSAFTSGMQRDHAYYVRTFAQWRVFRSLRRKIENGTITDNGLKWAQMRIRSAKDFLQWLHARKLTLELCSQAILDEWLTGRNVVTPYLVRDFIRWTNSRGITRRLDVPERPRKTPTIDISDEERWNRIERLLADRSLPNDVRLVGLLALVFAQQLSRMCALTVEDVTQVGDSLLLSFRKDPLEMPIALAGILLAQSERAIGNPKSERSDGKHWLFPGIHFGTHVAPGALQRRLSRIGVQSRAARNAALMSLCAQLEPGVVAGAFGLSVGTATRWALNAGRPFNHHVARRVETRSSMLE